jgi:hypothetical protein
LATPWHFDAVAVPTIKDAIGRSEERPSQATGYGTGSAGASDPRALTRGRILARIDPLARLGPQTWPPDLAPRLGPKTWPQEMKGRLRCPAAVPEISSPVFYMSSVPAWILHFPVEFFYGREADLR